MTTVQQWSDLEVVDLPKCGRCAFRGSRPENVRFPMRIYSHFNLRSYTLAKFGHMCRSVFASGDDIDELVS